MDTKPTRFNKLSDNEVATLREALKALDTVTANVLAHELKWEDFHRDNESQR